MNRINIVTNIPKILMNCWMLEVFGKMFVVDKPISFIRVHMHIIYSVDFKSGHTTRKSNGLIAIEGFYSCILSTLKLNILNVQYIFEIKNYNFF